MATVDIAPLTPEWYAARRKGIGASEIAAVLGLSPWESAFSLYWRKVNGWEFDGNDNTRTGTILEPAIAEWWARQHPDHYVQPGRFTQIEFGPRWIIATPDRLVGMACTHPYGASGISMGYTSGCAECLNTGMAEPPYAPLELKWTGSWDGWGEEGTDDIPVYYRAQVQWQMLALGGQFRVAFVAVLGPSGFREYLVHRDDRDLAVMEEAGRRFMARIEAGDPPPIDDHTATLAALRRLHPSLVDETAEVPDDLGAGYLRASAMVKKAETLKRKYEAAIREHAGPARTITTASGRKVATHVITDATVKAQPERVDHRDYLLAALPRSKRS